MRMLRVCERFGQDPLTWLDRAAEAGPGTLALLMAYQEWCGRQPPEDPFGRM